MTDSPEQPNQDVSAPEASESVNLQDLVLNLNFVPTWARKPSSTPHPYGGGGTESEFEREDRGRRGDRGMERRRDGRDARGGRDDRSRGGNRRRDERGRGRDERPRNDQGPGERRGPRGPDDRRRPMREPRVFLPVDVAFIPDRDRLSAVVRQLHAVKRAFPLPYLAGFFLAKPEYHMIKLEVRASASGDSLKFYQCKETRVVFLSQGELNDYLVSTHLDRHFDRVEQTVEPPSGNFVCVGQCARTGVLLGPPNYHGFNERLLELQRSHFPQQSLDAVRQQITMVRDPEVIERWKEGCRVQVRFRPKETPEAEATLTLAQAESQFLEKHAAGYAQTATKVIVPARVMDRMTDPRLRAVIQAAWTREDRFPFSLMLALRPAFRRMRLHLFKTGKDETFVTAIPPKPFDAEHAIPEIKGMVELIAAHPGWNRQQLVEKLYPGKSVDDPEVTEKMNPLIWLVDKGHVIEFFNGTYAVPGHLKAVTSPTPPEPPSPPAPA
ncbi:MAG TPA: hypothetical protein PKE26_04130 [Kiritimatiellia bacterium]|nr:hypothetical protein [Kiritimatiellia bacterium]HMO98276.1 hypothetical protein [Kiritimatiellia bacterium]HMP96273.1 hypothetical protein [Kiritimatiellia bacterium]